MKPELTSEQVAKYAKRMGVSMQQAKLALLRHRAVKTLRTAKTVEDLVPVIRYILEKMQ